MGTTCRLAERSSMLTSSVRSLMLDMLWSHEGSGERSQSAELRGGIKASQPSSFLA